MTLLTLSLLGGFQARLDLDPPLLLPAKAQALLAYLAIRPGQSHPRDKLAALLWGGTDDGHARSSLRHTLFDIRHTIRRVSPDPIVIDGKTLGLRSGALDVDVLTLERLVAEGTPAALEQAAAIYRGDLLEGLSVDEPPYEEWLVSERERLREIVLETLTRLLAHQSKSEPTEPAIQTAIRLLSLDPLQEAVHRALMRLYARQGRRGAALRQYQICVDLFQRELGAEPEIGTKQLYQEILQRRPTETVRLPSSAAVPAQGTDLPSQSDSPRRQTPLIGREDELAHLRRALCDAGRGHEPVVVILGDAGIGKSRLVEEISAEASASGRLVLLGRCYESERILPFGPWVAAFRAAQVASRSAVLDRLAPAWRVELARLLPELGAPASSAPPDRDSYLRLFDALAQLISALAAIEPIAVIIEDLHWADEMSIRLLPFLARRLETHTVLLLATARVEEMEETPALSRALEELAAESRVTQLKLAALSQRETEILVEALAPHGTQSSEIANTARRVWALSEGNPFMIVETTRAIREGRILETADGLQLPERIREVIVGQLARLSDVGRELAAVAALIGREFEFLVLQAAAGLSASATARGIEELVRRRVLHGLGDWLDFAHDRFREVACEGILAPRRKLLHARIARALEKIYAQNLEPHFETLGLHYREGEVWKKAVTYCRQAGAKAAQRSAYREAVACFEQALRALTHLPETRETIEQGIDLRLDLRNSLFSLRENRRVFDHLCEAQVLGERIGDQGRLGWIFAYMVHHLWLSNEADRAVEIGHRALAISQASGDFGLQVVANLRLGQGYLSLGDFRRASECFQSNIESLKGDLIREHFGEAWLPSVLTRVWLVHVLVERGEFAEAIVSGEEAAKIAETVDHPLSRIGAYRGLGYLYLRKGDFDTAIQFLNRCRELSQAWNIVVYGPGNVSYLGYAYVLSGRLTDGLLLLGSASNEGFSGYIRDLALSEAYRLANREEDATRTAVHALRLACDRNWPTFQAWALRALGDLASHRDPLDTEKAEAFYREAVLLADELGMGPLVAHCHHGLGKLYRRTSKREQAQEHLTTATTMYREMGMTYWLEKAEAE